MLSAAKSRLVGIGANLVFARVPLLPGKEAESVGWAFSSCVSSCEALAKREALAKQEAHALDSCAKAKNRRSDKPRINANARQ